MEKCNQCSGLKQIDFKQLQKKCDIQAADKLLCNKDNYWAEQQFQHLINWYFIPNPNNIKLEHQLLKNLAKEYGIIFQVWQIQDKQSKSKTKMISVSGIQQRDLLTQFVNHAVKIVFPIPTYKGFKFKILKNVRYTRYGSYELSQSLECSICLDKKTFNPKTCCGKFICEKCNVTKNCPFCNQEPIKIRRVTPYQRDQFRRFLYQFLKSCYELSN